MRLLSVLIYFLVICAGCAGKGEMASTGVSVAQLEEIIKSDPEVILVDVRRAAEIAGGVLPGNKVYIEYGTPGYEEKLAQLDKSQSYYLYCHSGLRSAQAANLLKKLGFMHVYNVEGGIVEWRKNGYKTE